MRVLIADDNGLFRRYLRELLEDHGLDVVGEALTGSSAVRQAREQRPDVTLLDLSIQGLGAVEATQAILDDEPGARILVLTEFVEDDDVLDALLAGACGYLRKAAAEPQIVLGVQAATAGDALISPEVATRLVFRLREQRRAERVAAPPKPPPLTARERDILALLAQGRENSAIAAELVISPATVKTHVAHLLDKLNLDNRVQAAVFAVRHGIV
jgi:DNA-binding NarL/FixJ family response regulator